jgi:putative DNA primase/helicase
MTFQSFAQVHGLIINDIVLDKWTRVPTVDHPHKRNGAYIYDGKSGAVQNWAIHDKPIVFRDNSQPYNAVERRLKSEKAELERQKRREAAARKATSIIGQAKEKTHAYLFRKGFNCNGLVYEGDLIIPMRINGLVVGCQRISPDGQKKFLYGQQTKGAYCGFDGGGRVILTEGYATALSVRRSLREVGVKYKIYVCFSAANILEIATPSCVIVADNDPAGIKTAQKSGCEYWVSDVVGEDANDYELRMGSKNLGLAIAERLT